MLPPTITGCPVARYASGSSGWPGGNARVEIGYRAHAAGIQPNFDGRFHH